jgi:hypothetical protein
MAPAASCAFWTQPWRRASRTDAPGSLAIAVPYRSPEGAAPLDILFPELLQFVWGGEGFDLLDAFFEGLESHGPAAEYWQEHARFERRKNAAKVP